MPVCQGCNGSYDDKFKFCPYCGKSTPESTTININVSSDDVWETCEIYFAQGKKTIWKTEYLFIATAIGSQGRYNAGRSDILNSDDFLNLNLKLKIRVVEEGIVPDINNSRPEFDALIKKLIADGWQPLGRGQEWYSERFRRKVNNTKKV